MKSGMLPVHDYGREPLEWTTTEGALADYLAARLSQPRAKPTRLSEGDQLPVKASRSTRRDRAATELRSVYRGILRDYFLAIMLRRRTGSRSATFRRCVLAGQIVMLASFAGLLVTLVRIATPAPRPEFDMVQKWIDEATDRYEVLRWHPIKIPPDGHGVVVEVEYKYAKDSSRTIFTRRSFRVVDETVEEIPAD